MFYLSQFIKRLLIYASLFSLAALYFFKAHTALFPWILLPFLCLPVFIEVLYVRRKTGHKRVKFRKYSNPDREMRRIDKMDGHDFEYFTAQLLKLKGFKRIRVTQGSGDYGVDIIATKGGSKYAVQCKRYKANVGVKAVQEVASGRDYYGCDEAIVVTTSAFTARAKVLAEITEIELWDREMIQECVMKQGCFD